MSVPVALRIRPTASHRCGLRNEQRKRDYLSAGSSDGGGRSGTRVWPRPAIDLNFPCSHSHSCSDQTVDKTVHTGKEITSPLRHNHLLLKARATRKLARDYWNSTLRVYTGMKI